MSTSPATTEASDLTLIVTVTAPQGTAFTRADIEKRMLAFLGGCELADEVTVRDVELLDTCGSDWPYTGAAS